MCKECLTVIEKHFGPKPATNYGFASDDPVANILWCATAFPICGPEQLDRQLTEFIDAVSRGESICSMCGAHVMAKDGEIWIEGTCTDMLEDGLPCQGEIAMREAARDDHTRRKARV
jgi:ribosomal protein S27AE